MKKIMLLIALAMSMTTMAQIAKLTPTEPSHKIQYFASCVYIYKDMRADTTYTIHFISDYRFENKRVILQLGNKEQAVESLQNIIDVCVGNPNKEVEIDEYYARVNKIGVVFDVPGAKGFIGTDKYILKQAKRWVEKQ